MEKKEKQLQHQEVQFTQMQFPITLFCGQFKTPDNVGMVFRLCDAFGLEKLLLPSESPSPENKKVQRVSRSTVRNVPHEMVDDVLERIVRYKSEGYTIVGLEITDQSIPMKQADFSVFSKMLVLCGSESHGIPAEILELLDMAVHIPMYGANSSMNVVNSVSILLYEMTSQMKGEQVAMC